MSVVPTEPRAKISVAILLMHLAVLITLFLDVPVARQVLGFLYFTIIPGFMIVTLLGMDKNGGLEILLLSVGFSVAFLLIIGLVTDQAIFLLGVSEPLSTIPIVLAINAFCLVGEIIFHFRGGHVKVPQFRIGKHAIVISILIALPAICVTGAIWIGVSASNLILLCVMLALALIFVVGVLSSKLFPSQLYSLAIFVIALSLLFHSSLVSPNTVHFGSDLAGEIFAFRLVEKASYWAPVNPFSGDLSVGRAYSMLSVTILPLIYSRLMNLDVVEVFKILYPTIFALVPVGLYTLWKRFMEERYAFASVFFFMSFSTFYTEMLGLNRQIIAELFFVLLLLVVLNRRMNSGNRILCFMTFSFALIVSHYGLAEIFLLYACVTLVFWIALKRPRKSITTSMVVFFLTVMFFWYIFTSSSSVFDALLYFGENIVRQFGDFFNFSRRDPLVLRAVGLEAAPTIWNTLSRAFAYLTEFLILIGFAVLVDKWRRTKEMIGGKEYSALVLVSLALLGMLVVIPGFSTTMNMTRFYHILLFTIAPLCVLGSEAIGRLLSKRYYEIATLALLVIVLVPYFLFQTGFVYEVTKSDSWSVPLSGYRMDPLRLYGEEGYTQATGISGARWLSKSASYSTPIYADIYYQRNELRGYGRIYVGMVELLWNATNAALFPPNATFYLGPLDVVDGKVMGEIYVWNYSELYFLKDLSKIYSNGGSEVYKNTP